MLFVSWIFLFLQCYSNPFNFTLKPQTSVLLAYRNIVALIKSSLSEVTQLVNCTISVKTQMYRD